MKSSRGVVIGLLIATIAISVYGVLNDEKYAKDSWHIPILVACLITARQVA